VPPIVSFPGAVVFEDWSHRKIEEAFQFMSYEDQDKQRFNGLINMLSGIKGEKNTGEEDKGVYPQKLRDAAAALLIVLRREGEIDVNAFVSGKSIQSRRAYLALPAGYKRFARSEAYIREEREIMDERWLYGLSRVLGGQEVIPVLPAYELFPWAASFLAKSPDNLEIAFDDRYFMSSNELNLLNTLLLASKRS
ncbi:MAG: hypothetical protein P3W87_005150, partial [Gammaproteobacteria bacterium]|nr:hypothetical protein [Gammaproteobacteria bacterium]